MATMTITQAELNQLEEIIIGKIQQRTPHRMNEEKYILKALKHNDLSNSGWVDFDQFKRALLPFTAGIHEQDMHAIFSRYTEEELMFYKDFAVEFISGIRRAEGADGPAANDGAGDGESWETIEDTLMRMKVFLYSHGPRQIVGLCSAFRDADSTNVRSIDYEAFHQVMSDFFDGSECPLTNDHLEQLFHVFQQPYSPNLVAYDELFLALKEEPSPDRRAVIRSAFRRLDSHSESLVDVNHMLKTFNASRHPQVADGSRSASEVLCEFEETLKELVAFRRGQRSYPTNLVAWEEFEDYYKFIGGCYESDALFCTALTRVWDLDKQSRSATDHRAAHASAAAGVAARSRAGLHHWQQDTLMQTDHRSSKEADLDEAFDRNRERIAKQGLRKATDVVSHFFTADDDVDDLIDAHEFVAACKQSGLNFSGKEQQKMFDEMGNGRGKIRVPDFLERLHGAISPARQEVVEQAFASLGGDPSDPESVITPATLKENFKSDSHPEVATNHRDATAAHTEFLDTFSLFAHARGGCQNGLVSFADFIAYYEVVSSIIDNDAYFKTLVRRCWSLPSTFCGEGSGGPLPQRNGRGSPLTSPRQDSPMAEPRPAMHTGPSAYSNHQDQHHRRFLRKEAPDTVEAAPMLPTKHSPITKSSLVFDEVDNSSELGRVIGHMRECVAKRGLRGWRSLLDKFQQYDIRKNDGIMRLDFERVHKTLGLGLTPDERETLFKGLATGRKDGAMDCRKCVRLLKGRLDPQRQDLVDALFDELSQGAPDIDGEMMKSSFIAASSPGCMFWKKPAAQMKQEFDDAVSYFGGPTGVFDKEAFDDFFAIVSAVYSHSDEFHLMATAAFGMPH